MSAAEPMPEPSEIDLEALRASVGTEVGISSWITVDQHLIDQFAEVSGDHQWIHVDPERAAQTPFGGTIAHGFLVLSLVSQMRASAVPRIQGLAMGINLRPQPRAVHLTGEGRSQASRSLCPQRSG